MNNKLKTLVQNLTTAIDKLDIDFDNFTQEQFNSYITQICKNKHESINIQYSKELDEDMDFISIMNGITNVYFDIYYLKEKQFNIDNVLFPLLNFININDLEPLTKVESNITHCLDGIADSKNLYNNRRSKSDK